MPQRDDHTPTATLRSDLLAGTWSGALRRDSMRREAGAGSPVLDRFAPLAGVGYGVLVIAGDLTVDEFPDERTSTTELKTYYAAHHAQVGTGGLLMALSVIFLGIFGAALWARAQRAGASLVVGAGLLIGVAVFAMDELHGASTFMVLGDIGAKATTDPAALQAWHIDGAAGGFGSGLVILLAAVVAAGLTVRAVPRWVAWSAAVLLILKFTPLAFFGSLLFLLWSVVVGIALTLRPVLAGRESAEPLADPAYAAR